MRNRKASGYVILWVFIACAVSPLSAQLPLAGWTRSLPDSVQALTMKRSWDDHTGIQPLAYGLEAETALLLDSSVSIAPYQNNLNLNPLFSGNAGASSHDGGSAFFSGMAGAWLRWTNKDRLEATIGGSFHLCNGPEYLLGLADSLRVVPGTGRLFNSADRQLPYASAFHGHIGYRLGKYFHVQAGNGKHFWGDGYRSLILSDNAISYPYLRVTTKFWHIKYTNLWGMLSDITGGQLFGDARRKFVALHSLSWNASKWLNFTAFEMVVWQDRDTLSRRALDLNYLNPVIFYRPVEFAQGSADNVLLGGGFRAKVSRSVQVYGQLVLDEFLLREIKNADGWWANKFGGQLGVKAYNVMGTPLFVQSEWNIVRPFTYTHGSAIQAWGNLNQPLAHPMGANFAEWVFRAGYQWGRWTIREQISWAGFGRDRDGLNLGGNIFRSYKSPYRQYGNEMLQGLKSTFHFHQLEVSTPLPGALKAEFFASHAWRYERNEFVRTSEHFISAGIRIPFNRPVQDF